MKGWVMRRGFTAGCRGHRQHWQLHPSFSTNILCVDRAESVGEPEPNGFENVLTTERIGDWVLAFGNSDSKSMPKSWSSKDPLHTTYITLYAWNYLSSWFIFCGQIAVDWWFDWLKLKNFINLNWCWNEMLNWCVHKTLVDLLGLLNWRSNPDDLDQILQRLMEVEGGEIVKVGALLYSCHTSFLIWCYKIEILREFLMLLL